MNHPLSTQHQQLLPLMIAAIGVVFGDIGTSPLYAIKEVLVHSPELAQNELAIRGMLSMIFWTFFVIVLCKYVFLVMRVDNQGEGGILALTALAEKGLSQKNKRVMWVVFLGIVGASMFYGDAVITPAISVLSAVEGLEVVTPSFKPYIIPICLLIMLLLFGAQRFGTAALGKWVGPITLIWFFVLALLGLVNIVKKPDIFLSINPLYIFEFLVNYPHHALAVIGSVFLVVTGAEALYADMGHFGYQPIRLGWVTIVMPSLMLNYLGQGALILTTPGVSSNPFFHMAPSWTTLPLVLLATFATVIASQAVISGAFSLTSQAIQLGWLPRMKIVNTSEDTKGQIYIGFVNWALFIVVVVLIISFGESAKLAAAYGIAVVTTMIITCVLVGIVMVHLWGWPKWKVTVLISVFLLVDLAFIVANALKVLNNGWIPLVLGSGICFLFLTWRRGRELLKERSQLEGIPLGSFVDALLASPPTRVQGTAVFLSADPKCVPASLLHNLKHNRILHERNVFLSVINQPVPRVADDNRLNVNSLGEGVYAIQVASGFMEKPNIQKYLQLAQDLHAVPFNPMDTSFFLSRDYVVPSKLRGMAIWREYLFAWLHRNAMRSSDFYEIPSNRVVELGTKVEI